MYSWVGLDWVSDQTWSDNECVDLEPTVWPFDGSTVTVGGRIISNVNYTCSTSIIIIIM